VRSWLLATIAGAGLLAGAGLVTAPVHAAENYPSWSEVEQARGNEQAKQAEIRRITGLLDTLAAAAADAEALATARTAEYEQALDVLDTATGEADALQAEADSAQAKADEAVEYVGQLVAQMARTGSSDLTMSMLIDGRNADDLLTKLGTASKLADRTDDLYTDATAAKNIAKSLGGQAQVAQKELTKLAAQAEEALTAATAAATAATAAVDEQEANQDRLQAQLAVLTDDRMTIEQGYAIGEKKRQEIAAAAAAAAAAEAAARAAATAAAASSSSSPSSSWLAPAGDGGSSDGGWTMPIRSYGSYQAYGNRLHPIAKVWRLHAGADFGAPCGTPLYAASSGTVTFAGPFGSYGNLVVIDHGGGISTAYAHMFSNGLLVRTGAPVAAGQQVAAVGNAGLSTGCHLHFELRRNGVATDPIAYMRANGMR
jgi:murein DD-endopeptidase MepM/ murein hydrolase activator NlpD